MVSSPGVRYLIRVPDPASHLVSVKMSIDDAPEGGLFVSMPVWTPGSYLVREYARHVLRLTARRAAGDELPVEKVSKNTWKVDAKPGKRVDLSYEVYANELTVRTSHVDADHAFLHPAALFLFVPGREALPAAVTIEPPEGWDVATALPLVGENTWQAEDLDHLIDSPFEIGTHRTLSFEAAGVPHQIALYGEGNFDLERLMEDTHAICRAASDVFGGEHPSRSYLFIFHVIEGAGGGLEHLDSSVCGFNPFSFRPERGHVRQLSLISHEYFHLWNVKRIRPRELGPFDYTTENYTRLLWVSEGVTSYYQNIILRRAGLMTVPDYLDDLARMIRAYLQVPGRKVDPVAEASFDAWVKLYRPSENTRNATVSYYLKGALVALLLDMVIRSETGGERSLDDAMRSLWSLSRARPGEGFTEEELLETLADAAGRSVAGEIREWVHGTGDLPFEDLLATHGLEFQPREEKDPDAWLGITTKEESGKLTVREVLAGSPAAAGGLDAGDELLALDGFRLGNLPERLGDRKPEEKVVLTVARRGRLREIPVVLAAAPLTDRVLRPIEGAGDREEQLFSRWLLEPLATATEAAGPPPKDLRPPVI